MEGESLQQTQTSTPTVNINFNIYYIITIKCFVC